jgi:DNA-binding SARP family transcriptional activator
MLFRVLGPLEVHAAEVHVLGVGKPAIVLATLLQQANAWVPVDRLIAATWPEADMPMSAEANLKTYVWQLRRMLRDGPAAARIERNADAYRLRVAPGELDSDRAREWATAARRPGLPPHEARALVERALALWRGTPYCGLEPAAEAATVLEELRLQLREQLAELQLRLGDEDQAVGTLRSVTTDAPLRESAWAHLVHALNLTGRRTEALIAYRRAAEVLSAELGVLPGPVLLAAEREVLGTTRRAPARADRGGPAVPVRRELPRAVRLIGRAPELRLLRRAATAPAPLVLVEGPAGIGKTALAVLAAHELAPSYPDGQFFLRLGRPVDALLDRLLRALGVASADQPTDQDEKEARWRSEVAGRRVLLILDDARSRDQVWPLLPAGAESLAIVTTRGLTGHLDGATRLPLGPLDPDAATSLYAAIAGTTDEQAIRSCHGNPAALCAAAVIPPTLRRAAV